MQMINLPTNLSQGQNGFGSQNHVLKVFEAVCMTTTLFSALGVKIPRNRITKSHAVSNVEHCIFYAAHLQQRVPHTNRNPEYA